MSDDGKDVSGVFLLKEGNEGYVFQKFFFIDENYLKNRIDYPHLV